MAETPTVTTQGNEPGPAPAAAPEETPFSTPPQEAAPEEKPSLETEAEPKPEPEFKGSVDDLWEHESLGDRLDNTEDRIPNAGTGQIGKLAAGSLENILANRESGSG